ncbi:MAG: GspE/PulE family protein [Candidatus Omnitrophota bacterium]|nr:GspE/PulE family protein [Candidatus Omnitrophota bacterium]
MPTLKENIIKILLESKKITKEQLEEAIGLQKQKGIPLKKILVSQGFISEEFLLSLLSSQLYIPILHLSKYRFDSEIIKLIPERIAREYNLIPLSRMADSITVAVSDPLNIFALDDLKVYTNCNIDIVLSVEGEIINAINEQYQLKTQQMQHFLDEEAELKTDLILQETGLFKQEDIKLSAVLEESGKAPTVKLVDFMLAEALKKRASDIHLEPEFACLRIRYRIDGALQEVFKIPKANQNAVIARIKIISDLDITETRIPQDGRFKVRFEGKEIDFRVSALPISFGQKFVLRVLDKANLSIGLDKIGFSEEPLRILKEAIAKPFGMILITGPTGSGKSTTLYSVLNQLNTPDRNIVTIEDPVEYQLDGITQVQVKPEINLSFASGLRSILRQNPDVIMIGEIRDSETADIATKSALTGQLVFSTLHTNDAISSITRLIDMGIEPFLVASSVIMLCAQRLCRKICPKCKKPVEIPQSTLKKIGFIDEAKFVTVQRSEVNQGVIPAQTGIQREYDRMDARFHGHDKNGRRELPEAELLPKFYIAQGCKYCNNTGFYGRIAILETVLIDDKIREMIIEKSSLDEIRKYASLECNMKTLRDDAYLKVKEGLTTLEEAVRITTEE